MYCPALKLHIPPFPVVYSPVTCAWCLTLSSSSFTWQKGHTVVARKSLSILGEFSSGNSSKRYSFTLSYNCTRYSMKGRRSSSFSCGAWNTLSWVSMTGMRDTARHDSMIGLCLFFSSMADSKSAYTTTGAGISYRWLVNSNRVSSFNKSYWSLSSTSSWCTCTSWSWTALRDPKKSSQNLYFAFLVVCLFFASLWRKIRCLKTLKYFIHQSIESGYHRYANALHR